MESASSSLPVTLLPSISLGDAGTHCVAVTHAVGVRAEPVGLAIQTILTFELNEVSRISAAPHAARPGRLGLFRCSCYVPNERVNVNPKVPIWLIKPLLALSARLA
jgi:hypothetical protein